MAPPDDGAGSRGPATALGAWLNARARPVFTPQLLDAISNEIEPLITLFARAPDPRRWNEPTWKAFQAASGLGPQALIGLAEALESGEKLGADLSEVSTALAVPGVNRDSLVRMMLVRAFASQVVQGELPSLLPDERKRYLGLVHDVGYAADQVARSADPTSILCPPGPGALLEEARLCLLPPQVRSRFLDAGRVQATRNGAVEAALPKLTLKDFFTTASDDAGSVQRALAFLTASGKDVDAPSRDLGGLTMREFLSRARGETPAPASGYPPSGTRKRVPAGGETPEHWLERLAGKQVFNSFARRWKALGEDAQRLEALGADGTRLRAYLEQKQTPALAPVLLVLKAPSLFEPARRGASEKVAASLDGLMQVFWRALSPHLSFSDPLVSSGQEQLGRDQPEQLVKDRNLWTSVVGLQKTRVVAGVPDQAYGAHLADFLKEKSPAEGGEELALALSRLERDLGPDHPALRQALEGLDLKTGGPQVVSRLHALRLDPAVFAIDVPPSAGHLCFGGEEFAFAARDGRLVPEFVDATNVAYRVQQGGRSLLLRLPKGAAPRIDAHGRLTLSVFDRERFSEVSARLRDFEAADPRVRLTRRRVLEDGQYWAVVEERTVAANAAQSLKQGAVLGKRDVEMLVDQWLAGLAERQDCARPYGVFFELGPDSYVFDAGGLVGSYFDVTLAFRNDRERAAFGFVNGGYGSAANWIVADNTPLSPDQVRSVWSGRGLDAQALQRRSLFAQALHSRLDPHHPVWASLPAGARGPARASLRQDLEAIGLLAPVPGRIPSP